MRANSLHAQIDGPGDVADRLSGSEEPKDLEFPVRQTFVRKSCHAVSQIGNATDQPKGRSLRRLAGSRDSMRNLRRPELFMLPFYSRWRWGLVSISPISTP
jgi:hypothetical protein